MPMQEVTVGDDRHLQDIADLLAKSHKIVVITGAGISTSCGIPDFRSKDGLYNLIPEQSLPTPPMSAPSTPSKKRKASSFEEDAFPCSSQSSTTSTSSQRSSSATKLRGQDLFDARVWKDPLTTAVFYRFIASLRQKILEDVAETSLTHKFIRSLRDGGRLMRCYTQNIDGLESREGLCMDMTRGKGNKRRFMRKNFQAPRPLQILNTDFDGGCEVVPLHGDLEKLRCNLCQRIWEWNEATTLAFLDGEAPGCQRCIKNNEEREARGKRGTSVGLLRPNIVLYGEEHPSNHLLAPLVPFDLASKPEVLLIMGTSLKVFGLQKMVRDFAKSIHLLGDGKGKVIFINRTKPAESVWEDVIDSYVAMDCDAWVQDLRNRRDDLWLRQGELDLNATKPVAKRKNKDLDPDGRPAKKIKRNSGSISGVELPKIQHLNQTGGVKSPVSGPILPTRPPVRGGQRDGKGNVHVLSTPQAVRTWKHNMYDNPLTSLLSPERPKFSPLRKSFKPPVFSHAFHLSPERPDYSPIKTPQHNKRKIQIFTDSDAEGRKSSQLLDVTTDGEDKIGGSPSKRTARHPLSNASLNTQKVTSWAVKTAKELPNVGARKIDGQEG